MHYCFFSVGPWEENGTLLRLRDLGSGLIRRGVKVTYLLDDVPYNHTMELHPDAQREFVPNPRSFGQFTARRKSLRRLAPDFLHIIGTPPKSLLSAAGTSHPIVSDWDEWPARRRWYSIDRRLIYMMTDKWLRRRAVRCIVASRYMQEKFRSEYGIDAAYIPHGGDYMPDYPDGPSPFATPTAVYMGNFYPTYDHDILFDAAMILKQRGLTPHMEIIGAGPDLEKWRKFVADNGLHNVSLPGYLVGEELWKRLRHAHVHLFPLRYSEVNVCRCPGKTFFYAQARRPVIATRVGEVPEMLKDKGAYIDCTPQAFADAIATAMATPNLPDVDYQLPTWDERAQALLDSLERDPRRSRSTSASSSVAGEPKGAA